MCASSQSELIFLLNVISGYFLNNNSMEGKVIEILNSTDPKPASDKPMLYTHLLCPYAERGRIAAALK